MRPDPLPISPLPAPFSLLQGHVALDLFKPVGHPHLPYEFSKIYFKHHKAIVNPLGGFECSNLNLRSFISLHGTEFIQIIPSSVPGAEGWSGHTDITNRDRGVKDDSMGRF